MTKVRHLLDLTGQVAVVTGAGGGLGAGIAERFAEAGAAVVVGYHHSEAGAKAVVARIVGGGGRAIAAGADLTRQSETERFFGLARDAFGAVHILINNAGTYPVDALLDMTEESWRAVVDASLTSVHFCTQAAARQMITQGKGGAIVNIASIEAQNPAPGHSHYTAAKAGVIMHTRTAAAELGAHGIRVNAVSPGLIGREGIEVAWPDGVRRYLASAPLGRLGRPDDVADACLFLASPAARWITGAELVVDGGVLTSQVY